MRVDRGLWTFGAWPLAGAIAICLAAWIGSCVHGEQAGDGGTSKMRIVHDHSATGQLGFAVQDGRGARLNLTYDLKGSTNVTTLRIEGADFQFGSISQGKFLEQAVARTVAGRPGHEWLWECKGVQVRQRVEARVSRKTLTAAEGGDWDTCLVRYDISNQGSGDAKIGFKIMVDTRIGQNDGTPFVAPGQDGRIVSFRDYPSPQQVPVYVKVLQNKDPAAPGFIACMTLRPGGILEPPDRVLISDWKKLNKGWDGEAADIRDDAAVAVYWNPRTVAPKQAMHVGYGFGAGLLLLSEAASRRGD